MVNIKPIEEAKKILDLGPKEEVKKNTASGNINPLVLESLNEAPKVIDDNFLSARIDHQKEHKGSNLSYMVPDLTNSYDMGNGPKHIQHNIIHKMNTEMQKLLSTLSALDNEWQSLRYQLHLSQSEWWKAKLIANEQMNLSNTLRVQKEARERELESSKDTINSLQQTIKTKDKDIEKLAQGMKLYCLIV